MPKARTPGAKRAADGEHLFDLRSVNRVMGGPDYSPVFGGCVEGEHMIVALMRYPAGQPSQPHSHPNEQWIYILEGELEMQFGEMSGGEWLRGGPGHVFYIPAGKIHCARNEGGRDCIFFTCKDGSHGLQGKKA